MYSKVNSSKAPVVIANPLPPNGFEAAYNPGSPVEKLGDPLIPEVIGALTETINVSPSQSNIPGLADLYGEYTVDPPKVPSASFVTGDNNTEL